MGEKEKQTDDESISIDLSSTKQFFIRLGHTTKGLWKKKYSKVVLAWILIAIIIFISTWYRSYPATLPITEDWVRGSISSNVRNQIAAQIRVERPGLPDSTVNQMVNDQYNQYYQTNKQDIENQVRAQSQQFKSQLQDENGQTYLLAIDPYLWYSYAKWFDRNGYWGNEIVDGEERFTLRNGRIGQKSGVSTPSVAIIAVHSVIKIFNPDQDILSSAFWMPPILIGLAIIPAFFLGKKLGGFPGGFFAAIIFALSPSILGRTSAGFSDTDAYTFIFPFLIMWLFLESIDAKTSKNNIILAALTGLSMVLFRMFWAGWWFTFDLLLGMIGVFILYKGVILLIKHKKSFNFRGWIRDSKAGWMFLVVFIVSSLIFIMIFNVLTGVAIGSGVQNFAEAPLQPIQFIFGFKAAASAEVGLTAGTNYPLWPNVFTTVAELNPGSKGQIIAGGGGQWMVWAAMAGIVFLLFKRKDGKLMPLYGLVLAAWMGSTYYAGFVGQRFIALFAPVVAFGIAGLIGALTGTRMAKIAKKISISPFIITGVIIVAGLIFVIYPQMVVADQVGKSEVPSYDDTWENALLTIKNSSEEAIITSWWDFGHWFQARSERSVTFDGGDQGKRIHWIGLSLLTDDEDEAIDILKMLNCGQEESYNLLEDALDDKLQATRTLKEIIRLDRDEAKDVLLDRGLSEIKSEEVLEFTHCEDLRDMYFITSGDMVGKSGVWGHFGSWDFDKAYSFYKIKNLPITEALKEAQEVFSIDDTQAKARYMEVQGIRSEAEANNWISPWPSYATGSPVACSEEEDIISCEYNMGLGSQRGIQTVLWKIFINKTDINESFFIIRGIDQNTGTVLSQSPTKPSSIKFLTENGFDETTFENPGIGFDVVVFKNEADTYMTLLTHPLLSESLFTKLFFLDGIGTEHFEKVFDEHDFRGLRIIVWKVNPGDV